MNFSKLLDYGCVFAVFLILFVYFLHPIPIDLANNDLGRHLLLGKIIVATKHVPTTNLLTYPFPNYPFINSHWLPEVIFFVIQKVVGFNGLIILAVLVIFSAFSITFLSAKHRAGIFFTSVVSLIYLQLISERTQIRPELFSFLFISFFIGVLYKFKNKYTKLIYLLVPLELIWVNTHIYFFLGPLIIGLFALDRLITDKLENRPLINDTFKTLVITGLSSTIVTIINPNFIKGATFPAKLFSNYGYQIQENMSSFAGASVGDDPRNFYFLIAVSILGIGILLAGKKLKPIDYLLALSGTVIAFVAIRNWPVFVFFTLPVCAKALHYSVKNLTVGFSGKKNLIIKATAILMLSFFLFPMINKNITDNAMGFGVSDDTQEAVRFLKKNNIHGPIYNNFDIGSYLEYKLYPQEKVFVDTRPEAYPVSFFRNTYLPMQESLEKFAGVDDEYNFNIAVIGHSDSSLKPSGLLNQMVKSNNWKMVYLNSTAVILLKNTKENAELISKNTVDNKSIKIPDSDLNNEQKVTRLSNFFRIVGWEDKQIEFTLKFLKYHPNDCMALNNLTVLKEKYRQTDAQNFATRYHNVCGGY